MAATKGVTGTVPRARRRRLWRAAAGVLVLAGVAAAAGGAWWGYDRARNGALARQARAAVEARRFDEARPLIDRWAAASPRDGEPYYLRARVAVAADRPQEALDALEEAVRRGFDAGPLAVQRAILLARAGRFDEAEPALLRAFDEAKVLDPEVAEALTRVYLGTFRLSPAEKVLSRWVKDAPADARPYLYRNEIDTRSDTEPAAIITNYRMALQRDPTLDRARLGLADKLRESQRVDEAEAEYDAYLERHPKSVDAHVGAGQVALRKGDLAGAVKHFSAALEADPKEPTALRELALIDQRQGRWDRARDRLRAVVALDPYDPEIRLSLARALKMTGDDAGSKAETAEVERLRADHRKMFDLRKALVRDPDNVGLRHDAARWLLDHGHEAEGLQWADLILRKNPGHPATCRMLVEYHTKKGNVGLANYYKAAASPR